MRQVITIDQFGNEIGENTKIKTSHPYNYDDIVQFQEDGEPTGTAYTDRLRQQDWTKYHSLSQKHFGDQSHYFDKRTPESIESFLQEFLELPTLKLLCVTEQCNPSSGFPLWKLDYHV